jgi:hypothetical protein
MWSLMKTVLMKTRGAVVITHSSLLMKLRVRGDQEGLWAEFLALKTLRGRACTSKVRLLRRDDRLVWASSLEGARSGLWWVVEIVLDFIFLLNGNHRYRETHG